MNIDITDQTGKGNKDIVEAYGKDVFEIMEHTLTVKIPYNKLAMDLNEISDDAQNDAQNDTEKNLEDKIIRENSSISTVSNPINKKIFDIFKTCSFGEESGHGVPTVVSIYGEKVYRFTESYINVIIPFDKSGFDNDDVEEKHPRNIQETSKKKYMN